METFVRTKKEHPARDRDVRRVADCGVRVDRFF